MLLRASLTAALALSLAGCPDFDASDELPEEVALTEAVLVPIGAGILAFPIEEGQLGAPAGFLGDPGDIADIDQRPDGTILCASDEVTVDLPEGFALEANGDVIQREDGTFLNLDDSPRIVQPRSVLALPDLGALILDAEIGRTVIRFHADGKLNTTTNEQGLFTEALSFVAPVDAAILGENVIILDAAQAPRLFRFGVDGSFQGAFVDNENGALLINPVAAAAGEGDVLFVAESTFNAVFAFDAQGQFLDFEASEGIANIADVAGIPGGGLIVADRGNADLNIKGGLRVFGAAGNLVQQIDIPDLETIDNPRIAVVQNVRVHPVR